MSDFLRMWASQRTFMDLLVSKGRFPEFPVDLTTKKGQQEVVHVFQHTMDELYEAKSELRNTKRHRVTEVKGFDREHFIEELVDVQKLLLEVLIMTDVDIEEFMDAYFEKSKTNEARVRSDY